MIKYYKLFDLLNRRDMNRSDLLEVTSSRTIAKLGRGENVETDVIDKICRFLDVQPGDIMEYVDDDPYKIFLDELYPDYQAIYEDDLSKEDFGIMLRKCMTKDIKTKEWKVDASKLNRKVKDYFYRKTSKI